MPALSEVEGWPPILYAACLPAGARQNVLANAEFLAHNCRGIRPNPNSEERPLSGGREGGNSMIDEQTIRQAVDRLLLAAPGAKVIVFGSLARGEADSGSDLDILVVEPHVQNAYEETLRLEEALRPLRVPVDLLVVSEEKFAYWRDTPNTIFYRALKEGRLYEPVA